MPDRFWVGGTASWDGTAGTKWATSSGGTGGASVPTSADDVFFTNLSTGTCTISAGNTGAKSINCTGFTGTLAGSAAITVSGSVTLAAAMTFTYSGGLTLAGTGTITSAGKTFLCPITINGSGITVTLGDALTNNSGGNFLVSTGTFNTANFNLTLSGSTIFNSSAVGNIRAINLGSSTVSIATSGSALSFAFNSGLTFNAGTSTIVLSGTGAQINGGPTNGGVGVTFNNVQFTSTAAGTHNIISSNTFNNLTVTAPSTAGVTQVTFDSQQTINGTLSTTGTAGNRRVWFRGATYGLAQTLTINSAPSLTDADFRDIYVIGTAAPISGTRIGDLRGIRGITASTPKTVYWNLAAGGNWSANAWAASSGGAVSTDNFPLAQDTAVIGNTGLNTSATVTLDSAVAYTGTINCATRTNAMSLTSASTMTFYGNLTLSTAVTPNTGFVYVFSGRNTQTITSAGKTLNQTNVDSYGGTVELADALNLGSSTLNVINGTFDTKNFNVTAGVLSSDNSNVRTINLGSSTLTLSGLPAVSMTTTTNLTLNAGTSQVNQTAQPANQSFNSTNLTWYNVAFTAGGSPMGWSINGPNTFNNLSITAPSSGISTLAFQSNCTINGTLTVAGATAVRRIFVRSDTLGTTRTLTVNSLSANDCDFRDITIAGAAAGSSPTRAGNCGGNTGITFPAAKTVYWNLAGNQNWSATGWATGTGGTPDINNFPLAQDTAVFDNAGAITQITVNAAWNIGSVDMSGRTTAMTWNGSTSTYYHGDWKFGTGVTHSNNAQGQFFSSRSTLTITSNGVTFNTPVLIDAFSGTVQLADAITLGSTRTLTLTSGTFDAVTYNVTTGLFNVTTPTNTTLKMGSGTWTISGTGSVWMATNDVGAFFKGTANIVLSDTSTSARTFTGNSRSYNKLTIGGTTGTSTTTITGNNRFTELASTKTVAHTIDLGSTQQFFGAWTVTGTAGNVVTLTGTGTGHSIVGACTSGIDYLAMGSIGFSSGSRGEFYAGANSTGTAGAPVYRTAKPADSTRYWVGGTGNWSDTARWSTSSGGSSGASVPRSHDDVVFDSASNATAYTATVNAVTGGIRTKSLTIAGPLTGNLTLAGSELIAGVHGNVTFPATGLTRTYTGAIVLSGSSTGRTFTTNGVTLAGELLVDGVGCEWTLGSALDIGSSTLTVTTGNLLLSTYNLIAGSISANNTNSRTINLGSGTTTLSGSSTLLFGITETAAATLTFISGTSQINCSATSPVFAGNGKTFNNVSFTSTSAGTVSISGANTLNNLSFTGITAAGLKIISLAANQTVTGTLTLSAGTDATMRHFVQSSTLGTTRTLTCAAFSGTDADFRDITIAGAAAPASGTRLGDCKGNSGITFGAGVTRYWNLAGSNNWSATGWAASSGGSPAVNNFPLAQDTAVFEATSPGTGTTTSINAAYNIGTIDMSARTSNTMTLNCGQLPFIHGNWINGTGITLSGSGNITFVGRGSQTITSAGRTFTQAFTVNSPGGSVTLQDAFITNSTAAAAFVVTAGTFSDGGYNLSTTSTASSAGFNSSNLNTRTLTINGTWTIAATGTAWSCSTSTNLTVTGTGTISLTSASAKTFFGGGLAYTNITLNQGGAGALTITGSNTFKDITNTYKSTGAANITIGTTTQRVSQWTGAGEAGRLLTVQGSSASSPGTLILSSGIANVDYLTLTGVRAYSLMDTWYAGTNSVNNGSLGWIFAASGGTVYSVTIAETATATDAINAPGSTYNTAVSETATITDTAVGGFLLLANVDESASAADDVVGYLVFPASVSETASVSDAALSFADFKALLSESASITDAANALASVGSLVIEAVTASDLASATPLYSANVAESATVTDSGAGFAIFAVTVTELSTITDDVNAPGSTYNPALEETATATDSDVGFITFPASVDESATGTDEFLAFPIFSTNVLETASISDSASTAATFTPVVLETATVTDEAVVAPSTFNAPVVEFTTVTDITSTTAVFQASLSESATATDVFFGGYLWNPIDDTQTANWQNINNTQTVTWTVISNTQSPGWQDIEEFK